MNDRNSLGILSMLLASIFFSLMNACIKILSNDLSIIQSMLFRSILMCLFLLPLFALKPLKRTHKAGGYGILALRALSGSIGMLLTFYNIATIPLGIASTFAQTVPLYAVFFAWFFLKESLHPIVFVATFVGFFGIVLISNPSSNIPLSNVIVGILSGMGAAIALVSVRSCKAYFEERAIILAFGIVATLMSLGCLCVGVFLPFEFLEWRSIPRDLWFYIALMGLTGTLGQYFMTKAFMLAPAGIISPIDYTKILFSLGLGIYLGDSLPSLQTSLGIMLVITSGLLIALPVFIKDFQELKRGKYIQRLLKDSKNIAIVGLSPSPNKDSYQVASYLQKMGYKIFPIYPKGEEILGERVYKSIKELEGERIDIAVVFRSGNKCLGVTQEILSCLQVKAIWLQLGIKDKASKKLARSHRVGFIQNRCIKIEREKYGS